MTKAHHTNIKSHCEERFSVTKQSQTLPANRARVVRDCFGRRRLAMTWYFSWRRSMYVLRGFSIVLIMLMSDGVLTAQDFIPLWPKGKMPNSKGLMIKDSIADERIYQVATPGMYAFFPSKQENKRSAVIICPGGGYGRLAYITGGTQLAKWFNTMGISAFVLIYRLPNLADLVQREIGPLQDAQRAMRVVRSRAAEWGIKSKNIGVMGTSAGGHLAALLSTRNDDLSAIHDELDTLSFAPDFMILVSPVISMGKYAHAGSRRNLLGENPTAGLIEKYSLELQVTPKTPPCFLVGAFNDKSVHPANSEMLYESLLENGVVTSFHVFPQGGHAIGVGNNPGSTALWTPLCEAWMREMGLIE
jgi:acetyl esterase/lipase